MDTGNLNTVIFYCPVEILLTHYRPAMLFRKNVLGSFHFRIVIQKNITHPSGNLKFNYLGIFLSIKLRILM